MPTAPDGRGDRSRRCGGIPAVVLALAVAAGACTSTPTAAPQGRSAGSAAATAPGHGPVDVLYAGSLVSLMEQVIGPRFSAARGYRFEGFAGGSLELANEIKGGTQEADVFVSASPEVNSRLEGAANGGHVRWYATFARAPLVLGYDPHGRFASQLASRPWYKVVTEPGFLLGRTDPALDPKGVLTQEALRQAASLYHDPALEGAARGSKGVFPEEDLLGRLEAGQLDAGFLYANEARDAHLPTVGLGAVHLFATYTVTSIEGSRHEGGAESFIGYLLGAAGRSALRHDGMSVVHPARVGGDASAVPEGLRHLVVSG